MKHIKEYKSILGKIEEDNNMDTSEIMDSLNNAYEKLEEAITYMMEARSAMKANPATASIASRMDAYLIPNLKIALSQDHGYMSRGLSIEEIIEEVREAGEEDWEDEEGDED
jgi:hypothetical protein